MRRSLAVLLFALGACGGEPPAGSPLPPEVKDLVVVVLDALPASGVGAYGYERDTTPNLDALAERGVRFENAYAGAGHTLPALAVSLPFTAARIPLAWLLSQTSLELHGIWIAIALTTFIKGVLLRILFGKGGWQKRLGTLEPQGPVGPGDAI